jgi:glutaminyl-peptide cyclotransferase
VQPLTPLAAPVLRSIDKVASLERSACLTEPMATTHLSRCAVSLSALLIAAGCASSAGAAKLTTTKSTRAKSNKSTTKRRPAQTTARTPASTTPVTSVALSGLTVLRTIPKDPSGFTQGLEVNDGKLYESVGLYGQSEMRTVDLTTGTVVTRTKLDAAYFAEGTTFLPDGNLVQLTWREKTAIVRNPDTLAEIKRFSYQEEGWGICYSKQLNKLVHSDGSSQLHLRDPNTFANTKTIAVTDPRNRPTDRLNELDCSGTTVLANVWTENRILEIDLASGRVMREIDASSIANQIPNRNADQVLNGIAALGNGRYLLTGKQWPTYFEVQFSPQR